MVQWSGLWASTARGSDSIPSLRTKIPQAVWHGQKKKKKALDQIKITLYARQQKRHRCIQQSYGLCGRGRGWDGLGEWHWNMYIIICEMNRQFRFDAGYRMLGAGALGWPRGMGWGGRWEGVQDGEHVYACGGSWWYMAKPIQYCKVKNK